MEIALAFVIYLLVSFLAYLGTELYVFMGVFPCLVYMGLLVVGAPWLWLAKLLKRDGWGGRMRYRFLLETLPIYDQGVVRTLFETWLNAHRLKFPTPENENEYGNGGFLTAVDETIEWIDASQIVRRFNHIKPVLKADNRSGIVYFHMPHPHPSGYNFIGKACIARVGPEMYGVYAESYALF